MKSPKLTLAALLSVVAVSSVFAADTSAGSMADLGGSADTPVAPVVSEAKPGRWERFKAFASAQASEFAENHPVAVERAVQCSAGLGAGLAAGGLVYGAVKAGQYGLNKWQNRSTEATAEDTRPFYKRHQKKLIGAGTLFVAAIATPVVAKCCGTDFSAQSGIVSDACKPFFTSARSKIADAARWAWNKQTAPVLVGEGLGAATAAVAATEYEGCGPRALWNKVRNYFSSSDDASSASTTTSAPAARPAVIRRPTARQAAHAMSKADLLRLRNRVGSGRALSSQELAQVVAQAQADTANSLRMTLAQQIMGICKQQGFAS